ncbi:hypothetical protein [Candidatus Uabimicrobium sp. HlEnr_7]|uniref:hypothetical protein n=1 Tax=Candidatus Uabimicrobium helgolandensis TaxID=3095367 RepID=UPI003557AE01
MAKIRLSHQSYEKYDCIEIPKNTKITPDIFEYLKKRTVRAQEKNKKIFITLPGNSTLSKRSTDEFSKFFQQYKECLFIPQEALKWGRIWNNIIDEDLSTTDMDKALAWLADESFLTPRIVRRELGNVAYIKFSGHVANASKHAAKKIVNTLEEIKPSGRILETANLFDTGISNSWVPISSALVLDIADVFILNQRFMSAITEALEEYNLSVSSKGIYFVTSGLFQSWQLKHILKGQTINEIGNIIRVVSSRETNHESKIQAEITAITSASQKNAPPKPLFIHKVQGHEHALKTIDYFSPDLVIVDEISEATAIKQNVLKSRGEKINHIIPAADPGLRILSPQMITKGYDYELFAEYVMSRYLHNRGKPNETYIYYLNTDPDHMRKVSMFLGGELSHVLNDDLQQIIEHLPKCETQSDAQGSFTIALLEKQFLKFEVNLHFTTSGFGQLLSQYTTLFPKHSDSLTTSIRLYLRAAQMKQPIHTKLHLAESFNEFSVKEDDIDIDVRIQDNRNMLTFKAKPHDGLEKRFKTLFTLLNGSDIFDSLPDKELFIELVSLLWESYQASMYRTQGFTISLISENDGSFQLEVFQSKQNKAILKGSIVDGKRNLRFSGNTVHHPQGQKRLLKMISLYFNSGKNDPTENTWRFACFEAMTQVLANGSQNQSLSFDFQIQEPRWAAVLMCDSTAPNNIGERSQKMFNDGADIVKVGDNGRQVTLVRKPEAQEQDGMLGFENLQSELDNLQENAILEKVENVKTKEAEERSIKLQKTYEEALKAYNQKYGGMDDDELQNTGKTHRPKTLEESARVKVIRKRQMPKGEVDKRRKKIRMYSAVGVTVMLIAFILFVSVSFSGRSSGGGKSLVIKNYDSMSDEEIEIYLAEKKKNRITKDPVPVVTKKLEKDPHSALIRIVSQKMYLAKAPSQTLLNSLLKKLYFALKENAQSADAHNLAARLFWYKIHLDKENIFPQSWKKSWRKEARNYFEKAKDIYRKNNIESTMSLRIRIWMPEYYIYESNNKKNTRYSTYKNYKEALQDLELLTSQLP